MREIEKLISELKEDNSKEDALLAVHFLLNGYNLGLQDAADNVKTKQIIPLEEGCRDYKNVYTDVDKESILKLKL
jgi:hypothetical protein